MHKNSNTRHSQKGFTTIEIAIVLLISGLIFVMLMNLYTKFTSRQAYHQTIENMDMVDKALTGFKSEKGYFPCPADPTLPPNHPDYGVATNCASFATTVNGQCSPTTRPRLISDGSLSNVICTNVETREVFPGEGPEYVLIGILPFRTLSQTPDLTAPLPEYATFDGYGNRLTYVVTERMADQIYSVENPVGVNWGAIPIFDENNRMITDPASNVYYLLISHGEDEKGAYSEFGIQVENCLGGLSVPPTPGLDNPDDPSYSGDLSMQIENCDQHDGVFRSALMSLGDNNQYFDDIVFYRNIIDTQIWQESALGGDDIHLYNTNNGFVGVGTQNPLAPLDVEGDVVVENQVHAQDGYCDSSRPMTDTGNEAECMDTSLIAGDADPDDQPDFTDPADLDNYCRKGSYAVGFRKNQIVCRPIMPSGPVSFDCGTNSAGQRLFARGLVYDTTTGIFDRYNCGRP